LLAWALKIVFRPHRPEAEVGIGRKRHNCQGGSENFSPSPQRTVRESATAVTGPLEPQRL
jgi:hypothetical protein